MRRLRRRAPGAAPAPLSGDVERAVAAIVGLLAGTRTDLSFVRLDLSRVPAFERRVYEAAREIAPGETRTHGELAALVGEPGAARRRPGNGAQPVSHRRAGPSRGGRGRAERRLFRPRRRLDEAPNARHRARLGGDAAVPRRLVARSAGFAARLAC